MFVKIKRKHPNILPLPRMHINMEEVVHRPFNYWYLSERKVFGVSAELSSVRLGPGEALRHLEFWR